MRPGPLRVTFVVPDLAAGGAERHLVTLVEGLDPERFDTRVVCLGREGELFDEAAAHVPAVALGLRKWQAVRAVAVLTRHLRRSQADVVVVRGYSAEMLGRMAALLAGVPCRVVWVHNFDDPEPRGRVRQLADRLLEGATDAYFGVAQRQFPYITEELGHPASKVRIIHNGVDPDRFCGPRVEAAGRAVRAELGFSGHDVVIGILAGLRPVKNHELFLEAAQEVAQRSPRARFLVVGDGEQRAHLQSMAHRLGLGERVVFAGFRQDVAEVLHAVDVVVLTSSSEAFPLSLLEAMAASRPVVSTAVGGVSEIVDDKVTGHLVPPDDVASLTTRLVGLVEDEARRLSLGRAGRSRLEGHFTLARSVEEAEVRLTEVAGGLDRVEVTEARVDPLVLTMVMDETGVGGVEVVTLQMFRAFDPAVVRPRLVCLRTEGALGADFRAAGFEVEVLDRTSWKDARTLPRLVGSLRRSRSDAVLVAHHHRASLVLARVAARLAGTRVTLVAAHDMDLVALGGRCLPTSTVTTLRAASALVVLAPSQSEYLHREEGVGRHWWSRTREAVIPNGIAIPALPDPGERERVRVELGVPEEAFVLGIVARLSEQKAHQVLLTAFARLRLTHPGAWLVVVGSGDREAELRELAQELGVADQTLFTGVRRDVGRLLSAFDVSCLSSVHEAAPITVIESMAAGLPVVATDCGALKDMIENEREGVLVPVGDSDTMADVLAGLADDPERRARMGVAGRRRAESEFAIGRTARGYERLLLDLVARR